MKERPNSDDDMGRMLIRIDRRWLTQTTLIEMLEGAETELAEAKREIARLREEVRQLSQPFHCAR